MRLDIERILIDRDRIARRVGEIASDLSRDLSAELEAEGVAEPEGHIVLLPIMTGALVFAADLIRRLPMKLSLELATVSSYAGKTIESRGASIRGDLPAGLAGKHVVIIDDILDSGRTMDLMVRAVRGEGAASVRSAVLLNKSARRSVDINADYVGFDVPDAFVVGYGLDFNGYYRNLPDIATLKPHAIRGAG